MLLLLVKEYTCYEFLCEMDNKVLVQLSEIIAGIQKVMLSKHLVHEVKCWSPVLLDALDLFQEEKKIVCTSEWLLLTSVIERPAAKQTWTDQCSYYQDRCTGGERWEEGGVHQSFKYKSIVYPLFLTLFQVINCLFQLLQKSCCFSVMVMSSALC